MKNKRNAALMVYLAALVALAPFSTDIYLASMPIIQQLFKTTAARVQLTLSLFFVTFALAQLIWGPLSDRMGRKPVTLIGVGVFILGSLLCVFSHNIEMFIVARVIQGLGASAGVVISLAMVRDLFRDEAEMARKYSTMMSVAIMAPILAPIEGSYLLTHFNWQANFYFLALYGIVLWIGTFFVAESYPATIRKPLPLSQLFQAYYKQLTCKPFLLGALSVATNFSVMFAFIAASSFIYIKIYRIAPDLFGYFFAGNASALIIGVTSLKYLKGRLADARIVSLGLSICFVASLSMLIALWLYPAMVWSVAIPSFIATMGVGLLFPELMAQSMQHVVDYTGLTSSLIGTIRFILAAFVGFLMGFLITSAALPLAVVMLVLTLMTAVLMKVYFS